mgnify:CR=1 FL=1
MDSLLRLDKGLQFITVVFFVWNFWLLCGGVLEIVF